MTTVITITNQNGEKSTLNYQLLVAPTRDEIQNILVAVEEIETDNPILKKIVFEDEKTGRNLAVVNFEINNVGKNIPCIHFVVGNRFSGYFIQYAINKKIVSTKGTPSSGFKNAFKIFPKIK